MNTLIWITVIVGTFCIAGRTHFSACRVPVRVRVLDRRPARARAGPSLQRHT